MPKKEKFFAVICPICMQKVIGNWIEKMLEQYEEHFFACHYVEPIIKKQ